MSSGDIQPSGSASCRWWTVGRLAIIGFAGVLFVLALILVIVVAGDRDEAAPGERVNVLASSTDECVSCHRSTTPGIVEQ